MPGNLKRKSKAMITTELIANIHAGISLILAAALLRTVHNGICIKRISQSFLYRTAFFLMALKLSHVLLPTEFKETVSSLFDMYLIGCAWLVTKKSKKPATVGKENSKNIIL